MRLLINALKLGLLNLCLLSYSQDWSLINPDYKYNYSKNGESLISTTIWSDSMEINGNSDTIYFLNRIVTNCDTCNEWIYSNKPKYAFFNQPQFMQRTVTKTDSDYFYCYPNNFTIYHQADSGYSWIFDTLNNITATLVNKSQQQNFDLTDSIKTIQLSTGDTIVISKNFGIYRFDDVYDSNQYNLVGINNLYGDSVPDFFDFYDFSVGDIFQFEGDYQTDVGYGHYYFKKKIFIKSKTISNDTIIYDIHHKYYEIELGDFAPPPLFVYYPNKHSANMKWNFVNLSYHPTNRFNNESIQNSVIYNVDPEDAYFIDYTILRCYKNSEDIYTKTLGSFENCDFMSIYDTSQCMMERADPGFIIGGTEIQYQVGLGQVYYDNRGFEWWRKEELVAYVKDNDTVGTLTNDSFFSDIEDNTYSESVLIFPNPSCDIVYVKTANDYPIREIKIINMNGSVVKTSFNSTGISVEDLEPSLYIIEIISDNFINRQKLIVKE